MISRRGALAGAVVALLLGAWAFYALAAVASRGGETAPLYSNRRHDAYGTAALFRLLGERRAGVVALERPRLTEGMTGTLVQVLPLPEPGSGSGSGMEEAYRLPTAALLEWVAAGNTVIQLTRGRTELMARAGIDAAEPVEVVKQIEAHQRRGDWPDTLPGREVEGRWTRDARQRLGDLPALVLRTPTRLTSDAATWRVLARADGGAVAGELAHGDGQIVVVGAPTPALNGWLAEGGNLEALLGLLGDGPVVFDEWSHGLGHAGTITELLRRFGLVPLLVQLALVVLAYRWSCRGREGVPPAPVPRRRSVREQVAMLGHLYAQSLSRPARVQRVSEEVRRRFAAALRCGAGRIDERLAKAPPELASRVKNVLAELHAIERRHPPLCRGCGYDLTGSEAGRCPECGQWIPLELRQRITAGADGLHGDARSASRESDRDLARILSVSHQLAKDLARV